jgi:hypothetical protein
VTPPFTHRIPARRRVELLGHGQAPGQNTWSPEPMSLPLASSETR